MRTGSLLFCALVGCGAPAAPREPLGPPTSATASAQPPPARRSSWVDATRSPWPHTPADERVAALTSACGVADGALARVATRLVAERARGLGAPDPDRVVSMLRREGEPHLRPRIVSSSSRGPHDDDAIRANLEAARRPGTRCGVALARPEIASGKEGNELFVAVAVDALADLEALPTRARTGEWLTFSAVLRVPAASAKLVVLGPRGLPRTVPTSLDRAPSSPRAPTTEASGSASPPGGATVRARFALDQPGAFTVQLVAELASGPAPLLEARVFADVDPPPDDDTSAPAPGEDVGGGDDDVAALARMTAALRASESLPALRRDERLDALARAHAEQMRRARAVVHDLGDGDLAVRFESAGLAAKVVGENVARARSVRLAHRALHASPSHRRNLLSADYTHVGLGVVTDDAGDVYACEVFAGALR
ncbi:MAG: CAP domain-containing protein [Labilithrix sp.]|nr:CAP domain-containing protein [Labilithrix sp.]